MKKITFFLVLILLMFKFTKVIACEDKPVFVQVISSEIPAITGSFSFTVKYKFIDTTNFVRDTEFQLPDKWSANINPVIAGNTYMPGDSILVTVTVNYPTSDLPFYPQKIKIIQYVPNQLEISVSTMIYFTPYNTIEIWSLQDYYNLPRHWLNIENNPNAQRIYISKDDIPVSNLDLSTPVNKDEIDTENNWQENFREISIYGLAYNILMKPVPPDSLEYYKSFGDGPDSSDTKGNNIFKGSVVGYLKTKITNDIGQIRNIGLAGIKVTLRERDSYLGINFYETIGSAYTKEDGSFEITYETNQKWEGKCLELSLKFFSFTKGTEYNVFCTNALGFHYNFTSHEWSAIQTEYNQNAGTQNPSSVGLNEAFSTVHWARKSFKYFENQNYPLAKNLRIDINSWTGSWFQSPDIFLGGKPVIHIEENDGDRENTTYHEFGHFAMYRLQNNNMRLPWGENFFYHTWGKENTSLLTWIEGWADAVQMILDAAYWQEDREYGLKGGQHEAYFEDKQNQFNINNGIRSEYYVACSIYDLWDGQLKNLPLSVPNNPPDYNFDIHGWDDFNQPNPNWTSVDDVELNFADLCKPLVDHPNDIDNIQDYYNYLLENFATDCQKRADISRAFRENCVVWNIDEYINKKHNIGNLSSDDINSTENYNESFNFGSWTDTYTLNFVNKYGQDEKILRIYDGDNPDITDNHWIGIWDGIGDPDNIYTELYLNQDKYVNGSHITTHDVYTTCGGVTMDIKNGNLLLGGGYVGKTTADLIITDKSLLRFRNNGNLDIMTGSSIIIKEGGTLYIENDADIILHDNAKIIVESGGYICIEAGANIYLWDNSVIDLQNGTLLGLNPALNITPSPTCINPQDVDIIGQGHIEYICEDFADYTHYDETIVNYSDIWNTKVYLFKENLIITNNSELTINNSELQFAKAKKIIVEPGSKLILNNTKITNLEQCGTMWQGIEVWGNKDLSQYPQSNQGVVELKNGATIENARCAITTCQKDTVENIFWNYTGGIIHAKNANFINNRKAIEFLSYHNILPNGREIDNSSYFNNCTFETNAQLSDPGTLPETFVSLYDVKGVKFLGCTFQNTAPTGVYSTIHRGNGITSVDANYEVKPSCLNPYIYPCSEYQPNTFQNLYYGIYASNTNPAITLTINGNNFDNNHRSIFLKGINNATITKNNFDIGATIGNINDQTNEREECEACDVFNRSYSYGVYLKECSGYKVEENNFSTSHDGHAGIIVNNSGTKANEIYNNTFDKLAIGTQAQGVNAAGGVIISKSSNPEHIGINVGQGLQFLCNQYFNISSADIAVTSGRIAQKQGYCHDNNPALPAGNKFSHNCISTSDIHVNSDASKFNYNHHSEPDDYVPQCYSSDKVTLHNCDIEYDSQISCPSHLNSGLTPVVLKQIINTNNLEIEELISLIDNGETETLLAQIHQDEEPERIKNALESASPYLSDRVLLAAIKEKPTPLPPDILKEIIISNSPVTDTVMSALNTLKLPDDIQQQIQEVRTGTSARAELEQQISYMESQKDIAENELMRQYLNDTTINGIDSIIAYLETQRDLINKKQLVQAYLVANQCEKAKILLEQLPQENDEDKNFYNFYNLLSDLCVSEKTYFELTSAQEQTVREIAKSETSVSVNAQAILSMVYNEKFPEIIEELKFIVDLRNAPQQGETLGDNITKQIQFVKIYPNPAENIITIELSAELDNKNISVEIYNYLGQKVIFYNFAGDLLNTLDVSDLSNGIYIFKILVGNKIIAREKVVIEK